LHNGEFSYKEGSSVKIPKDAEVRDRPIPFPVKIMLEE
jgi:hypothetical protein